MQKLRAAAGNGIPFVLASSGIFFAKLLMQDDRAERYRAGAIRRLSEKGRHLAAGKLAARAAEKSERPLSMLSLAVESLVLAGKPSLAFELADRKCGGIVSHGGILMDTSPRQALLFLMKTYGTLGALKKTFGAFSAAADPSTRAAGWRGLAIAHWWEAKVRLSMAECYLSMGDCALAAEYLDKSSHSEAEMRECAGKAASQKLPLCAARGNKPF